MLPFQMVKAKKTGVDIRYWLGLLPPELKERPKQQKTVWIHAVSVGEVNSVRPLIRKIKETYPEWTIVLSTVTGAGQTFARKSVSEVDHFIFFPSDLPWTLCRFFRYIHPQLLIIVETELWPNLITLSAKRSVPVILVNGSISSRSISRYRKIKLLFQPLLNKMTLFLMQSSTDAERIISIGAPPEKVFATGNIKFDVSIPELSDPEKKQYLTLFGFNETQPIWLVGSTHPGEETIILRIYASLRKLVPDLKLILVPRHPHRADEVVKEIEKMKLSFIRRSELTNLGVTPKAFGVRPDYRGSIILVDTVGELTKLYSLATVVFLGGSLVPIGGHNVLEPAILGKPVVFGPYIQETRDSTELLLTTGGGIQVHSEKELEDQILYLLNHPEERIDRGEKAKSAVIANQGATTKTLALLGKYLT
ncbi:MAG: 3-deoxy-D-manno-octulosonic acid transferase [bacterium]|nr:3-deoxy-D-manno-octulosonic acid transferase [bacterium]